MKKTIWNHNPNSTAYDLQYSYNNVFQETHFSFLLQPAPHFSWSLWSIPSFGISHRRMNTKPRLFNIRFLISGTRKSQPYQVSEIRQPSTNLNMAA
jgi:hypothetical protein